MPNRARNVSSGLKMKTNQKTIKKEGNLHMRGADGPYSTWAVPEPCSKLPQDRQGSGKGSFLSPPPVPSGMSLLRMLCFLSLCQMFNKIP